jgi:hypothetical protein
MPFPILGALALGSSVFGGIMQSRAAKAAAKGQEAAAQQQFAASQAFQQQLLANAGMYEARSDEALAEGREAIAFAYQNIGNIISKIPQLEDMWERATKISDKEFDFMTEKKRENLDFITGGTEDELRSAQSMNASLAALDESAFTSPVQKILRSNISGIKASVVGEPIGTFANLSARNLRDMSNEGLSNTLRINDFFSKEGTVDPISPYVVSGDLLKIEFDKADRRINNEEFRASSTINLMGSALGAAQNLLGAENNAAQAGYQGSVNLAQSQGQLAGASQYANANMFNTIATGLGQAYGMHQSQQTMALQEKATNAAIANAQSQASYYQTAAKNYSGRAA